MLRILHVEDDRVYLSSVKTAFAALDDVYLEQVETLAAAQVRLSDISAPAFDALLVDLKLLDAREMEAVAVLRVYDIPLVVLSAYSSPEKLELAAEAGADGYIVKGTVDANHIVCRVRFACRRHFKQNEALASAVSAATSSRSPFGGRSLGADAFEALKPFISCGHVLG